MKRLTYAATCIAAVAMAGAANAQTALPLGNGFYALGYGGLQFFTDNDIDDINGIDKLKWDTGYNFGVRIGMRTGQFRVEGELGYRTADGELKLEDGFVFGAGDDGDVELTALQGSVNLFYDLLDLPLGTFIATPYVGGGLGYANVEIESDFEDDDESDFLALFEAGLTMRLSPNLSVVPAYRYEYVNIEVGDDDLTSHGLQIGARFDF